MVSVENGNLFTKVSSPPHSTNVPSYILISSNGLFAKFKTNSKINKKNNKMIQKMKRI